MEWTKEQRYRKMDDVAEQEIQELVNLVNQCQWRQTFHIQTVTGLLNDPNGFSYFNGEYHLFYQWFPLGPVHGLKYWYHTKSKDLVHWENVGIAIDHLAHMTVMVLIQEVLLNMMVSSILCIQEILATKIGTTSVSMFQPL